MGQVKFDIILMEVKLPQMNGEDVARMIRTTQNHNSSTPIVGFPVASADRGDWSRVITAPNAISALRWQEAEIDMTPPHSPTPRGTRLSVPDDGA
ncbi:hypothetical protein BDZ91DRAFT_798041 [Kalaharituber pfeilii]|nr:hypothetical protein BDZ91DRAFT_798041 [Kalaharituber pfeilii]